MMESAARISIEALDCADSATSIDALGGTLNVESPLSGGTTIRATIPYRHGG
jgi:hypothetical protein